MNSDRRSPIRSARSFLEFNYTAADRAARSLPVERSARRSINVRVRGPRRNNRAGRGTEKWTGGGGKRRGRGRTGARETFPSRKATGLPGESAASERGHERHSWTSFEIPTINHGYGVDGVTRMITPCLLAAINFLPAGSTSAPRSYRYPEVPFRRGTVVTHV